MKIRLLLVIMLVSCFAETDAAAQTRASVWAVDFVKTRDGQQANYLKFVEQNWARARTYMKQKGIAYSYRVLSLPAGQQADWDVLLMTEYAGREGYEQREEAFKEYQAGVKARQPAQSNKEKGDTKTAREMAEIKFDRLFYQPIAPEAASLRLPTETLDAEAAAARVPLENYLRGHATGNAEFMRRAFHTEGNLIFLRDGKYTTLSFADYIARMEGKPAADEHLRKRWIESVDVAGNSAVGKIILDYPSARITDYMTLLKINGEWKIVNKSFSVEPKQSTAK